MIDIIRKGIYARANTTSNFKTALLQSTFLKVFYYEAPEYVINTTTKLTIPFCVFDILPIQQNFDTVNKFYVFTVQFRIVSDNLSNRDTVLGYLYSLFDNSRANLSFTGYYTIEIKRGLTIELGKIDNYWNTIAQYRLEIQKS